MLLYSRKSVTLIELLIAIGLLAVIILGINNIDIFSRYHYKSTDRRAKLQNDVSLCLEHITKNVSKAVGNETVFPGSTVAQVTEGISLSVFTDANDNGLRDLSGSAAPASPDRWVSYVLDEHSLNYFADCADGAIPACPADPSETLSTRITNFTPVKHLDSGYIEVAITACWDPPAEPDDPSTCGTPDNPSVSMSTTISLPSVSSN